MRAMNNSNEVVILGFMVPCSLARLVPKSKAFPQPLVAAANQARSCRSFRQRQVRSRSDSPADATKRVTESERPNKPQRREGRREENAPPTLLYCNLLASG